MYNIPQRGRKHKVKRNDFSSYHDNESSLTYQIDQGLIDWDIQAIFDCKQTNRQELFQAQPDFNHMLLA
jgi:hypothetical protein